MTTELPFIVLREATPDAPIPRDRPDHGSIGIETLLRNQLVIAADLQRRISALPENSDVRELRDLIMSANTLVTNAHRAHESLRELATYREFVEVVIAFITSRQDSLGEDLLDQLQRVVDDLRCGEGVRRLVAG